MKPRGFGCTTLVFLFVLGMGVTWLVFTLNGMKLAEESAAWSSTTGTIVKTWMERDEQSDPDGQTEIYFKPHVQYSYDAPGGRYTSQRVDFGAIPSFNSSSRAEDYLDQYPLDSEIEVFYDPDDPGEAVLVREATGSTWSMIGSTALIIFSVVGWVGALVKRNRRQVPFTPGGFSVE